MSAYVDAVVHLLVRVRRYECAPYSRSWSDSLQGIATGMQFKPSPSADANAHDRTDDE